MEEVGRKRSENLLLNSIQLKRDRRRKKKMKTNSFVAWRGKETCLKENVRSSYLMVWCGAVSSIFLGRLAVPRFFIMYVSYFSSLIPPTFRFL